MRLVPYSDEHLSLTLATETDPDVMKYPGGARPREAVVRVHGTRVALAASGGLYFVIVEDERPAGQIGIWQGVHEGAQIHEMGWTLLPEFQGRGLVTAAGREVLERARARPEMREVWAFPGIDNGASNAICRKLGFEQAGETEIEFSGRKLRVNEWRIRLSSK
jgi:RimJ/RimL family protein N-acetyltransferase